MGESIWCSVDVKVPTSWGNDDCIPSVIDNLHAALRENVVSFDQGDGSTIWNVNGDGNYGLSDDDVTKALDELTRLRVPFVATSDAKYDFGPERWIYDGNDNHHVDIFDGTDQATITLADLERLGSYEAARDYLRAGNRTVGEFNIDHLPTEEPTDDERDDEREG